MKTPLCSLLLAAVLLPLTSFAADPAAASAAANAQAADFSNVAPARSGNEKQPATNPTPGSLNPQKPVPGNQPRQTDAQRNPSASGLTTPGATSGSSLGDGGSNSTLKAEPKQK